MRGTSDGTAEAVDMDGRGKGGGTGGRGFTLVEALVAMSIAVALAVLTIPNLQRLGARQQRLELAAQLNQVARLWRAASNGDEAGEAIGGGGGGGGGGRRDPMDAAVLAQLPASLQLHGRQWRLRFRDSAEGPLIEARAGGSSCVLRLELAGGVLSGQGCDWDG